jgi:hypothetical protein
MGLCAASFLFMALYGLARISGMDFKMGSRGDYDTRPPNENDWIATSVFGAVALTMLSCALIPARPWSWGVGLAALIIGLPCCVAPAVIILVFWCQMPTRLYFITHGWRTLPPPVQPPPPMPG